MTDNDPQPAYGLDRRKVTLAGPKVTRYRARLRERGHVGATLVYVAVIDGARRARAGLPLPAADGEPVGGDGRLSVTWSQPQAEFDVCVADIEGAGSSLRAVIGAFVEEYAESGSPLEALPSAAFPELAATA